MSFCSHFFIVGAPRFELGTSSPPDWRANQAAPRPATPPRYQAAPNPSPNGERRYLRQTAPLVNNTPELREALSPGGAVVHIAWQKRTRWPKTSSQPAETA